MKNGENVRKGGEMAKGQGPLWKKISSERVGELEKDRYREMMREEKWRRRRRITKFEWSTRRKRPVGSFCQKFIKCALCV